MPYRYAEQARQLSNDELWQVYSLVPDVRAAIDATVLRVSTWDWDITPQVAPEDPDYEALMEEANRCKNFLMLPNTDRETYQEWTSKLMRDLLVFDALAVEHVMDNLGQLAELVAIRGGDVTPIQDMHQRLIFYKQINRVRQQIDFEPEQMTYLNLFPNTTAPGGKPLIETLITEIITLLQQSKTVMRTYDADEIPPGILVLAGIAGKAADKAVASLQNMRGHDEKLRVLTFDNATATGANWVELKRTFKDMELKDVVKEVRRTVWRIFHVKPVTMGDSEATPRATGEVQLVAEEEGLIIPFLELWEQKINAQIMPLLLGDPELASKIRFCFDFKKKKTADEEEKEARADGEDLDRGVISINERRKRRGMLPIEGGDEPYLLDPIAGLVPVSKRGTKPTPDQPENVQADPKSNKKAQKSRAAWRNLPPAYGCAYEPALQIRGSARFPVLEEGMSLDLDALSGQIQGYTRQIMPLYRTARQEVITAMREFFLSSQSEEATRARIDATIKKLTQDWAQLSSPFYRQAAMIGQEAAIRMGGSALDWRKVAADYHSGAMVWLSSKHGLVSHLRTSLDTLMTTAAQARNAAGEVQTDQNIRNEAHTVDTLNRVRRLFDGEAYRVANWAGKLNELAHGACVRGLPADKMQVRWTLHPDCWDCEKRNWKGWVMLSQLDTYPAGQVQRAGHCRCALSFKLVEK
jgi:hypothetical protein